MNNTNQKNQTKLDEEVVISENAKTTITIGAFLLCIVLLFAFGTTRSAYLLVPIVACFVTSMFTSSQGYIDPSRGTTGEGHYADPTGRRTRTGLWIISIGATTLTILHITLINVMQFSTTIGRLSLDLKGFAGPFFVVAILLGLLVTFVGRR